MTCWTPVTFNKLDRIKQTHYIQRMTRNQYQQETLDLINIGKEIVWFSASWICIFVKHDTNTQQETFLYDWSRYTLAPNFGKIGPRETYGLRSRWRCWAILPRPFLNTPEYVHFHHFLTLCQVSKLFEHVKALKKPLLLPGKKIIIIIIIGTISIGPLTIRCSGPKYLTVYFSHKSSNIHWVRTRFSQFSLW